MDTEAGKRMRRILAALILTPALAAVALACTDAEVTGRGRVVPTASQAVRFATSQQESQLVLPVGRHYVRWTPGSHRHPARILPIREMSATAIASSGRRIYWLNRDQQTFRVTLRSVTTTGAHPRTLLRRVGPAAIVAARRRHVYWDAANGSAISRIAVDSGRVQHHWLVGVPRQTSGDIVDGLATDRHFLYLSQCFSGRIGRVPLDVPRRNRQIEWIIRGIDTCPAAMTISNGFVYWAGSTLSGAGVIGRAPVAGGAPTDSWIRTRASSGPRSLAAVNGFLYWDWGGTPSGRPNFLGRVSVNGTRFTRKVRKIEPWPITAALRPAK